MKPQKIKHSRKHRAVLAHVKFASIISATQTKTPSAQWVIFPLSEGVFLAGEINILGRE